MGEVVSLSKHRAVDGLELTLGSDEQPTLAALRDIQRAMESGGYFEIQTLHRCLRFWVEKSCAEYPEAVAYVNEQVLLYLNGCDLRHQSVRIVIDLRAIIMGAFANERPP